MREVKSKPGFLSRDVLPKRWRVSKLVTMRAWSIHHVGSEIGLCVPLSIRLSRGRDA